ncbi:hypothetical protein CB0940_05292 [Cercospora beticola]|uniref:F-box domain-containing protein n=1 Tax=Cercospora beticola TaxID=122368 RepID=A0A2G5I091_CERBT|nr:hypothetical protein CB0940_05292 [Cercospora beticola]PIA98214.1 hypothetical protein CB0940_05292 [Cercospora beticola]WPA97823.1 hypothetical protein RHO25_002434 [Cercospora beticola]CAK1359021.1 unnamed protein product [Cercospora beticola]
MGYSEVLCTICGVSFNIGRVRRKDEPKSAAWDCYNAPNSYQEADVPDGFSECGETSGCTYYSRNLDNGCYKSPWHNPEAEQDRSDPSLEHIAGPGCKYECACGGAYTGNEISFEEMQGCTTFQCLVRKRNDWKPACDDEEFEQDPNFPMFLSGLHDRMPEREIGYVDAMHPMRHNMQEHSPDDVFWDDDWERNDYSSLPFHPWCLEVYKRASKTWFDGKNDHMVGLVNWWRHRTSKETFSGRFSSTSRSDDVGRLNDQWWNHEHGTEYAAANPPFIPNLAKVIANATAAEPVDGNSGVFDLPADTNLSPSPGDGFAKLPAELKLEILSSLSSEDICNLRLVSRSFRQLPLSLFRDMLATNLNFFWEASPAKDQTPYPFLATTTAQKFVDSPPDSRNPVPVPNLLDTSNTNWYKLYYSLRRGMRNGELKGLANRNRIWNDCQSILESIVKHWDEWQSERD